MFVLITVANPSNPSPHTMRMYTKILIQLAKWTVASPLATQVVFRRPPPPKGRLEWGPPGTAGVSSKVRTTTTSALASFILRWRSRPGIVVQTVETALGETLPPLGNGVGAATHLGRDVHIGAAFVRAQGDAAPHRLGPVEWKAAVPNAPVSRVPLCTGKR